MSGGEHKDTAMKVTNSLINIRAISSLQPRIEAWLASQQLSTPSEAEILEVVKTNYDSLHAQTQESLDVFGYTLSIRNIRLSFTSLVHPSLWTTDRKIVLDDLDLHAEVLQNFIHQ